MHVYSIFVTLCFSHCLLSLCIVCIVYLCKHVLHKDQIGLLLMNKIYLILSYLLNMLYNTLEERCLARLLHSHVYTKPRVHFQQTDCK